MAKSRDAFRTISEVAEWLETPAHVLRFWESKFTQIKPVKRAGGRRYYRPADMKLLGGIKQLLHEDGMTIKGVQKVLREQGVRHVAALNTYAVDEDTDPSGGEIIEDAPYVEVEVPDSVVAFPGGAPNSEQPETLEMFPEAEDIPAEVTDPEPLADAVPEEASDWDDISDAPSEGPDVPEPDDGLAESPVMEVEGESVTEPDDQPEPLNVSETVTIGESQPEPDEREPAAGPASEIEQEIPVVATPATIARPALLGIIARVPVLTADQAQSLRPLVENLRSLSQNAGTGG